MLFANPCPLVLNQHRGNISVKTCSNNSICLIYHTTMFWKSQNSILSQSPTMPCLCPYHTRAYSLAKTFTPQTPYTIQLGLLNDHDLKMFWHHYSPTLMSSLPAPPLPFQDKMLSEYWLYFSCHSIWYVTWWCSEKVSFWPAPSRPQLFFFLIIAHLHTYPKHLSKIAPDKRECPHNIFLISPQKTYSVGTN